MRTQKPKKQFCDQAWFARMKANKRQELVREGREIPDWLIPRVAKGEQLELFMEGPDGEGDRVIRGQSKNE